MASGAALLFRFAAATPMVKPLLASTFHIHCVSFALSLSHSLCRSGQRCDAKTKSTPVKGERFWRANPAKEANCSSAAAAMSAATATAASPCVHSPRQQQEWEREWKWNGQRGMANGSQSIRYHFPFRSTHFACLCYCLRPSHVQS